MKNVLRIGIQGSKGSFNEEALGVLTQKNDIDNFETVYCFTTEKVLQDLEKGRIDLGVFAVYNSRSRLVDETAAVLGHYRFDVVDYVTVRIAHQLMTLPEIDLEQIETIIGHEEAIAQCQKNLQEKFADKKILPGSGRLVDGASAAQALREGELNPKTAVLGSSSIAKHYNLQIVSRNLQDDPDNTTTFLFVRPVDT